MNKKYVFKCGLIYFLNINLVAECESIYSWIIITSQNVNEYKLCEFCTISPTIAKSSNVVTKLFHRVVLQKGLPYHRFRWYAILENKTPAETFPKFPVILGVIDRSDRNPPITATSVTSNLLFVMLSGCDWWISIRSVNNTQDWRKFWKRFRGCFVFKVAINENGGNRRLNLFSGNPFYPRLIIPGIRNLIAE